MTIDYLQLYAEDADDDGDLEMDETVDEENVQDRDFIDDRVFFSDEPSFYRGLIIVLKLQHQMFIKIILKI